MAFIDAPRFAIRSIEWVYVVPSNSGVSPWTGRNAITVEPWRAKWRASVVLASIQGEENIRAIRSFLARCEGSINPFRLSATEGAQNENEGVTVSSAAAQGATSLQIAGHDTPLKDGQFVTVNGQLLCCVADQSGSTISFRPPLREAAPVGTGVATANPYAVVYMLSSRVGWSTEPGRLFAVTFDVEEAVAEGGGLILILFDDTDTRWDSTTASWDNG